MYNDENLTYNQKEVITAFKNNEVREDHYDGENSIYGLSANLVSINGESINDINLLDEKELERIKKSFEELKITPVRLFVFTYSVEALWGPNKLCIIQKRKDYLNLSLEFADYLDNLEGIELVINKGMYDSDPEEYDKKIKMQSNLLKFNYENFNGKMEIIDFRRRKLVKSEIYEDNNYLLDKKYYCQNVIEYFTADFIPINNIDIDSNIKHLRELEIAPTIIELYDESIYLKWLPETDQKMPCAKQFNRLLNDFEEYIESLNNLGLGQFFWSKDMVHTEIKIVKENNSLDCNVNLYNFDNTYGKTYVFNNRTDGK